MWQAGGQGIFPETSLDGFLGQVWKWKVGTGEDRSKVCVEFLVCVKSFMLMIGNRVLLEGGMCVEIPSA